MEGKPAAGPRAGLACVVAAALIGAAACAPTATAERSATPTATVALVLSTPAPGGAERRQPPALPDPDSRRRFSAPLDVAIAVSEYGRLEAIASAGATCTAAGTFDDGRSVDATGLQAARLASTDGRISWNYERSSSAPVGSGIHAVRCARGTESVSAAAGFRVPVPR